MCARITLATELEVLKDAFPGVDIREAITARYNIAPSQEVAAITNTEGMRFAMLRWGLIPRWAKDAKIGNSLINARSESLAEKPSFREAFRRRRCLIIADGFYEWSKSSDGSRVPTYIRLKSGLPFGLAGLWEIWEGAGSPIRTCTVITTVSNELIAPVYDRMPVIIKPDDYARWLDPHEKPPSELGDMLVTYPTGEMTAYEVSKFVNDTHHDSPECIEPA